MAAAKRKDKAVDDTDKGDEKSVAKKRCRSLAVAENGVSTGGEFASMMSALMSDIIEGSITPQVANAVVNAGGKLLKVTELQLKYGQKPENAQATPFKLN